MYQCCFVIVSFYHCSCYDSSAWCFICWRQCSGPILLLPRQEAWNVKAVFEVCQGSNTERQGWVYCHVLMSLLWRDSFFAALVISSILAICPFETTSPFVGDAVRRREPRVWCEDNIGTEAKKWDKWDRQYSQSAFLMTRALQQACILCITTQFSPSVDKHWRWIWLCCRLPVCTTGCTLLAMNGRSQLQWLHHYKVIQHLCYKAFDAVAWFLREYNHVVASAIPWYQSYFNMHKCINHDDGVCCTELSFYRIDLLYDT